VKKFIRLEKCVFSREKIKKTEIFDENEIPHRTILRLARKKMKLFGRLRTLLYVERHPPPFPLPLDHFCLFNVVDNLTGLEGEEG
jgi:hypothetical protein